MKCAYCEYSVPVKNSPCFNCTYSGDDSKRTDKCDEALQFMWMYNKESWSQNKEQTTVCNVEKTIQTLEKYKSIPETFDLPNNYRRGYITGLNAAIKIVSGRIKENGFD